MKKNLLKKAACLWFTFQNSKETINSNSYCKSIFFRLCITIITLLLPLGMLAQTQIGEDIDSETDNDWSGYSVSISADGTIVAIGAPYNDDSAYAAGHVRVYQNNSGTWTQLGGDIDGEASWDLSGQFISISADGITVAIGAKDNGPDTGHVRVYQIIAGTWTQVGGDINGEAAMDESGTSVSINADGSIVAIGAPFNDGNGINSGHVRVYQNNAGTWTQVGSDIDGEADNDWSGYSVSMSADGSMVAIGAPYNNGVSSNSGHVRVYQNNAGTWTQVGSDIDGEANSSILSGWSVSMSADGTTVAIGTPWTIEGGHVRVYQNNAGTWTQVGTNIDAEATSDQSGWSVSINADGTIVAIGAVANNGNGSLSGHVRVYQNIAGTWTQVGEDIDGEAIDDRSGFSVSMSANGNMVAIGTPYNQGNGASSGHVRVYDLSSVLGINENEMLKNAITIYPNPVKDYISINNASDALIEKLSFFDVQGRKVKNVNGEFEKISINSLSDGLYFLKIKTDKGIANKKVFVSK